MIYCIASAQNFGEFGKWNTIYSDYVRCVCNEGQKST